MHSHVQSCMRGKHCVHSYICCHVACAVIILFTIVLYFYIIVLQFLAVMLDVEEVGGITEATPLTTPVVPAAALAVALMMDRQGASQTRAAVAI